MDTEIVEGEFSAETDPAFRKYYAQRYRLFRLFDQGIKLDKGKVIYIYVERV